MTREKLAKKIHWSNAIFIISVVNPLVILPQLIQLWRTHQTAGLSIEFLVILVFVQCGFCLHGFFKRDRFIMGSNGLAALMSLLTLFSTLYLRSIGN